ncbi:hypothetical protein BDZ91DRAFT_744152 [Kalaharituber pfeilii]|nr:hypothetical protein BDZ91DRAFT_744152 [Kalaharituber pfeilii]
MVLLACYTADAMRELEFFEPPHSAPGGEEALFEESLGSSCHHLTLHFQYPYVGKPYVSLVFR